MLSGIAIGDDGRSRSSALFVRVDTRDELVEVIASELPAERDGPLVVADLEAGEALRDLIERGEIVGFHDFALHDRQG